MSYLPSHGGRVYPRRDDNYWETSFDDLGSEYWEERYSIASEDISYSRYTGYEDWEEGCDVVDDDGCWYDSRSIRGNESLPEGLEWIVDGNGFIGVRNKPLFRKSFFIFR